MHHNEKDACCNEGCSEEDKCCNDAECCDNGKECCCCCDSDSCCEGGKMTKEDYEARLTMLAQDVWYKLFLEACEKEWKKAAGKNIQKLAAMHVKKSKKEWDEKMN